MANTIQPSDAIEFLRAINRGEVTLLVKDPMEQNDPIFRASNGWRVSVFNDAGGWDYVWWIQSNDGRTIDFDALYVLAEQSVNAGGKYQLPEGAEPTDEQADQYWHWQVINNPPSSLRFIRH